MLEDDHEGEPSTMSENQMQLIREMESKYNLNAGELRLISDVLGIDVDNVAAHMSMISAAANIGSCGVGSCGKKLRYVGRRDGLRVCCTGNPRHCWNTTDGSYESTE